MVTVTALTETLQPAGYVIVASAFWALWRYLNNRARGESFDGTRLLSTLVVGVGAGIAVAASGLDFSQETWAAQVAVYTPLIMVVDNTLSHALRDREVLGVDVSGLYNGGKFDGAPEEALDTLQESGIMADVDRYMRTGQVPEWDAETTMRFYGLYEAFDQFADRSDTPGRPEFGAEPGGNQ